MGSGTYYSAEVNEDPEIKEFISDKLMQRVASDLTEGKANIPSIQMALKRDWQGEFKTILEPAKNSYLIVLLDVRPPPRAQNS